MGEEISSNTPEETAGQWSFLEKESLPDFDEDDEDSKGDDVLKEIEAIEHEILEESYEMLDKSDSLSVDNKFDIAGVLAGIKPIGLIFYLCESETDYDVTEVEFLLRDLGLSFNKNVEISEYDESLYDITISMSLNQELLEQYLNDVKQCDRSDYYLVEGSYLGYPRTAVEFFSANTGDVRGHEKYHMLIHSPEHVQEEFENYEAPIMAAMEEYFPLSAQKFKDKNGWPDTTNPVQKMG